MFFVVVGPYTTCQFFFELWFQFVQSKLSIQEYSEKHEPEQLLAYIDLKHVSASHVMYSEHLGTSME